MPVCSHRWSVLLSCNGTPLYIAETGPLPFFGALLLCAGLSSRGFRPAAIHFRSGSYSSMSLLPSMLFGWSPRLAADSLLHLTSAELFIFQDCFLPGVASLDGLLPPTAVLALLRLLSIVASLLV